MLGDYKVLGEIGVGVTGRVFKAMDMVSSNICAVKRIGRSVGPELLEKERTMSELMKTTDCLFVSKIYDVFEEEDALCVAMEFCAGGTLMEMCSTVRPSLETIGSIFYEIIKGLEDMHKNLCMIHRDLKVENVLLDRHGHVRLSDFGLSTYSESDEPLKRTACGSPAYAAPEVITRDAYTSKVDVWSAGVILYFLVVGKLPFNGNSVQECYRAILNEHPVYPEEVPAQLTHLLMRLLEKDSDKRITIDEILEHPWVRSSQAFGIERLAEKAMRDERVTLIITVASTLGEDMELVEHELEEGTSEEITRTFRIVRDVMYPDVLERFTKNSDAGRRVTKTASCESVHAGVMSRVMSRAGTRVPCRRRRISDATKSLRCPSSPLVDRT